LDRTPSRDHHPAADFNRALRSSNDADAFASLLGAAEAGCVRAQFLVGLAYHTGRGVALDCERAGVWYRKAAGSGDSHAIANLGVMSLLGQGAPADDLDAYTWVRSAVGLGHEWLRPALDLLERRVTGGEDFENGADRDRILASVLPETPAFRPCTQPGCDPSRCNVA
jgi:TPR repeat protein